MRALITGVGGFAGAALATNLLARGWLVHGSHGGTRPLPPRLLHAGLVPLLHDLGDAAHTLSLLREAAPDTLFHLAGHTGTGFAAALQSHAAATVTLLEAVRQAAPACVVVVPGSSAQFGEVAAAHQPIAEDAGWHPATLYGIAKVAEAAAAGFYHREHGLRIVRTHTFNCFGPGQRAVFVPAAFASQVAAIERGTAPPMLMVGNLEARRDLTDIRDVAEAYRLLALHGVAGEIYNICSGEALRIGDLVASLCRQARVDIEIRHDPARLQVADVAAQRGDPARIRALTGWRPSFPPEQTLTDVLEEWRAKS